MTHKNRLQGVLAMLLILMLAMMLAACGSKTDGGEAEAEEPQVQEEAVEETEEAGDAEGVEKTEMTASEVVKVIDEIDTEDMQDIPLQIESITLFEDGTLRIVPVDDLMKNAETNDELIDGAIYPFEESGKVKDVYLVRFGNGGYRTIICIMDDGSLSAMSANELIKDHITVIWDNLTGRDTYVSIEDRLSEDQDAFLVYGITEDGEEIDLNFSLDF